jgi:Putative beta-barrel porin-2, OmpL-like. bbp2
MKFNKWTVGLAAVGVISLASAARADEQKMNEVQTALSNTTLSGYVDVGLQFSPGNTGANYSYGGNFSALGKNQANGFTVNAVDLALDKPMDETPWASGYHVELEIGPNIPFGLRQAYLALRTPIAGSASIDWKIGYFDTIIGYESNSGPLNPNYTRSYGYTIEPTGHTGIIGTYKVCDALSVTAGVADKTYFYGNTSAFDTGLYTPTLLGSLTLTAPDSWGWFKGASLSAGVVSTAGSNGGVNYYVGTTMPTPWAAWKVGAAFDYVDEHSTAFNPHNDSIWNLAVYSSFQVTDKLSLNARGEYVDGQSAGFGATDGIYPVSDGYELTLTVQYNLWANVLSRAEVRWDHSSHGFPFASPGTPEANAYLFALNLVYQF